jgi:Fe-S-cluster containining protein
MGEAAHRTRLSRGVRRDRTLLTVGFAVSAALAAGAYLLGYGFIASLVALLASAILVRVVVYLYFERFLAFRTFEDFRSERILHECIACGACCHLRVNLGKDDAERIIRYSREHGLDEIVIEKRASNYWLKRNSGECCFLTYSEGTPRCRIYSLRPVACRLYPVIPTGSRLKADPLCPGFNKTKGRTFKEYVRTQEVVAYVKKVTGKI